MATPASHQQQLSAGHIRDPHMAAITSTSHVDPAAARQAGTRTATASCPPPSLQHVAISWISQIGGAPASADTGGLPEAEGPACRCRLPLGIERRGPQAAPVPLAVDCPCVTRTAGPVPAARGRGGPCGTGACVIARPRFRPAPVSRPTMLTPREPAQPKCLSCSP